MGGEMIVPMIMMAKNCPVTNPDALWKCYFWLRYGIISMIIGMILMMLGVIGIELSPSISHGFIFAIGQFTLLIGISIGACAGMHYWLDSMLG